jgi:tripartite-type tricarboxylate transporter receptor subunit TctC
LSPQDSLAELSAYVKANAKTLNLANAGLGAVSHLCGMLFGKARRCTASPRASA